MDAALPKITAHRGVWGSYFENTLEAVDAAIEAGVDYVEIDVRLTADGEVVALHDRSLQRIWGVDRDVDSLPWETIATFRAVSASGNSQRIPLLSEVLGRFQSVGPGGPKLLIDMDHAEVALPALRVVASGGVRVAWCGYLEGMLAIRRADAEAEIWMPWNQPGLPSQEEIDQLRPAYINSNHLVLSRADIAELHGRGLKVSVWTVDHASAQQWAIGAGVDAITTNDVAILRQTLSADSPSDELEHSMATARQLAAFAVDYTRSAGIGEVQTKAHEADLVTEVDTAIERFVRKVIGERFPNHAFVGEEYGGQAGDATHVWYLDPVDGTTNLANGQPWTSFSLALAVDGRPEVAVVADPWRGDIFEASAGAGAKLNGQPIRLQPLKSSVGANNLAGRLVSTELAGHQPWPGMVQFLNLLAERHCTMRIMGSGTMTLTGIAAGRGIGSVIHHFSPIDHLAAVLIASEAGASVLNETGAIDLFPQTGGVLVAHHQVAGELFSLWREASS